MKGSDVDTDLEAPIGRHVWGRGLHHASDTLIKRGTAMGPLALLLFLVPIFLLAAWMFRDMPIVLTVCVLIAVGIPLEYARQFGRFAAQDPERLQSEHYRYELKRMQMIAAKELPYPLPADSLGLPPATTNPALPPPVPPAEDDVRSGESS